jgi:AcrR family transcriptional regulator
VAERKADELAEEPAEFGPLPGGRHSISPEVLAHNQRERLIGAIAQLVAEHGYADTTIRQIADTASVSRRTVYEHFSGKEEIFLAAYEALDDYLAKLMADAAGAEDEWADQVAASVTELICFFVSRPNLARLYLIESAAVGEPLNEAREKTAERLVGLLVPWRQHAAREPAEGMGEALAGGVVVLLARRIVAGQGADLESFIPAVIEFVLSPYLGIDAAREVAARHS